MPDYCEELSEIIDTIACNSYGENYNTPEFEVLRYCQRTECLCNGCATCHPVSKYSRELGSYDRGFQKDVDKQISDLIAKGYSRQSAVIKLLESEVNRECHR
jgi:hypothetical protein